MKPVKQIAVTMAAVMLITLLPGSAADSAKRPKLNRSTASITVGKSVKLTIKNGNKKAKVTWKTSKKSIAKLTSKSSIGNTAYAKIQGVKAGKAKIHAYYRLGKKTTKYTCIVRIKNAGATEAPAITQSPATAQPAAQVATAVPAAKAPTLLPAKVSTEGPSKAPSSKPTQEPVTDPSQIPSQEPSAAPSEAPTKTPTDAPTKAPTQTPTKAPTQTPTKAPTKAPTQTPTKAPTKDPTGGSAYIATKAPATKSPNATAKPLPTPALPHALDLRTATKIYSNDSETLTVNGDGTITGTNIQGFLFPLDDTVSIGDSVEVTVFGNASDTIRGWLSADADNRGSDITNPVSFGQTYTFEVTGQSNYFQIKKKSYQADNFTSITITKIMIKYIKAVQPEPIEPEPLEDGYIWATTWGTAEEKCDTTDTALPQMALNGTTVRQIIRPTTSGKKIKLRLSNQYGQSPVKIKSMHLAKQVKTDASQIDTSTDTIVTVGGLEEFTIPAGAVIQTDGVNFNTTALENIAVSMYFGETPTKNITGHRGARATTYQMSGNNVSTTTFTNYKTTTSWFFLADISLAMPTGSKSVVCFGDSITDGYGTDATYLGKKPDSYTRWGDYFAKRLQANEATKNVGVINEGIGANAMFGSYPTDAGKDRFKRDLLEHDSVAYCIILFGVNDLNKLSNTSKYEQLLPCYQNMVKLCHDNGIKCYGAPILPFGTSGYYSTSSEAVRQKINNWMRSTDSQMDGIIDFDKAIADPANPINVLEKYTHSDGLHPYDGYDVMADAIDLSMFE